MAGPSRSPHGGRQGIAIGLISAAAFATSGPFAKSLLEAGWSPGAAVTGRITGAALLLAIPAALELRGRWHVLRSNAGLILTYGLLAVAGCQLFYFNAVQTLSVGVALLLEYLGLVLVVGWLWLRGQPPRRWTIIGVVLAVTGLVLVLDVTGGMRIDPAGVLWGLGAAVGLAAFFVLSAHEPDDLPPLSMAASGMAVAATALLAAGAIGVLPMEFATEQVLLAGAELPWFAPVVGLCLISSAIAYALGITAARTLGSKLAAFLGLTEVLFTVVFAWLLLDELPLPVQLVGGVLIVGGVAAVRYDDLVADPGSTSESVGPAGAAAGPADPPTPTGSPDPTDSELA